MNPFNGKKLKKPGAYVPTNIVVLAGSTALISEGGKSERHAGPYVMV